MQRTENFGIKIKAPCFSFIRTVLYKQKLLWAYSSLLTRILLLIVLGELNSPSKNARLAELQARTLVVSKFSGTPWRLDSFCKAKSTLGS